jgi:hypothetical protein
MLFDRTICEAGISIDPSRTKITLSNETYYRISYGIDVFSIDKGRPRLELLANGCVISGTNLNMECSGFSSLDLIYKLEPNAVISLRVVGGAITVAENNGCVNEYLTIASLR